MPRNPYPYPYYENDISFTGLKPNQTTFPRDRQPTNNSTWERLNNAHTLQSMRKQYFHYDPQAPNDRLDFTLKSDYDQHREFLKDSNETLVQSETLDKPHGRVLRNRPKTTPAKIDLEKLPITINQTKLQENPNRIKGAVEGHHNAVTNNGFSRKHDGGFYTS